MNTCIRVCVCVCVCAGVINVAEYIDERWDVSDVMFRV
jgi:hypothetical protein